MKGNQRIYVLAFISLVYLALSVLFANKTAVITSSTMDRKVFYRKEPNWTLGKNPLPPYLSKKDVNNQLYVLVLDREYEDKPHQCIMKQQWMNPLLNYDEIDGIEIYSVNKWVNKECNISSITISEMPKQKIDPSAFLLYNSLKLFLERSDAGWLFIVGDAVYIKTEKFMDFFREIKANTNPIRESYILGNCVEERYYSDMLLLSSGVFLSRNLVKRFINKRYDDMWSTAFTVGITDDEILAKIYEKIDFVISTKHSSKMLGRGWINKQMYDIMTGKRFDNLSRCEIPDEYLNPKAGELGLCAKEVYNMSDICVWAGTRFISKLEFLSNAEKMLSDIPKNVGFYWEKLYPSLCLIY